MNSTTGWKSWNITVHVYADALMINDKVAYICIS